MTSGPGGRRRASSRARCWKETCGGRPALRRGHPPIVAVDPLPAAGPHAGTAGLGTLLAHGRFVDVPAGPWAPGAARGSELLLVVGGMLLVEHGITSRVSAEALGPGDAFTIDEPAQAGTSAAWGLQAVEATRVFVLHRPLAGLLAEWPQGGARLVGSLLERHRRRSRHQAILARSRVEDRVLLVHWALAERFGTQARDGAELRLPLTHHMIGGLSGSQRSTVTSAVGKLHEAGLLARRPDGALWVSAAAAALERDGRLPG